MTTPNCDSSDLWQETIEGDSYLVDGHWRQLQLIHEPIRVKGVAEPIEFVVKSTHRGVIVTPELLLGAEGVFFGA
jgi:acyl-homoserine lactone acylase PvdQ